MYEASRGPSAIAELRYTPCSEKVVRFVLNITSQLQATSSTFLQFSVTDRE